MICAVHNINCLNKWIKFYICSGDHLSPAVCLDAKQYLEGHNDCSNRYGKMEMDDILQAVVLELSMRPPQPKSCIAGCDLTPVPIMEEPEEEPDKELEEDPEDESEDESERIRWIVEDIKRRKEKEEAAETYEGASQ